MKPHDQGGLCGIKFTPEQTFVVGETLNIQWKAEAEFLAEPYKGSDAYETHDGLMVAMVSTFKGADMKLTSASAFKCLAQSSNGVNTWGYGIFFRNAAGYAVRHCRVAGGSVVISPTVGNAS